MLHIIVAKKQVRRAVDRNRIRRRVRAALDKTKPGWRTNLNGKIFTTPEFLTAPFPELIKKIRIVQI